MKTTHFQKLSAWLVFIWVFLWVILLRYCSCKMSRYGVARRKLVECQSWSRMKSRLVRQCGFIKHYLKHIATVATSSHIFYDSSFTMIRLFLTVWVYWYPSLPPYCFPITWHAQKYYYVCTLFFDIFFMRNNCAFTKYWTVSLWPIHGFPILNQRVVFLVWPQSRVYNTQNCLIKLKYL